MKKILFYCATLLCVLTGCKNIPTPEKMEAVATSAGFTTGVVVKNFVTSPETIETITNLIVLTSVCTPTNGQTFADAWTPIAENYLKVLEAKGKITKDQGILIKEAFVLVTTGIDYLFDTVYPNARKYEELVSAAIHGFDNGFLKNFSESNKNSLPSKDEKLEAILTTKSKKIKSIVKK